MSLFPSPGFPDGSLVENLPANARDVGWLSVQERSPGEGNGNPLQYSCLENPMHRGAWWATVYGVTKESDTTERLKQQFHAHLALSTSFCYITLTLLSSLYICFLPRTCISQEQDSLHTKHNLCSSYMSRNVIDWMCVKKMHWSFFC